MKSGWWVLIGIIMNILGMCFYHAIPVSFFKVLFITLVLIFSFSFHYNGVKKFFGEPIKNLDALTPHHYRVKAINKDEGVMILDSDDGVRKYVDLSAVNNDIVGKGSLVKAVKVRGKWKLQLITKEEF
jgi:energy-coupling factor transporter transmembrane protein EcfT